MKLTNQHIGYHGQTVHEVELLENESNLTSDLARPRHESTASLDKSSEHFYIAAGRGCERRYMPKERGFARPGGTQ